jgi:hypothetical protein
LIEGVDGLFSLFDRHPGEGRDPLARHLGIGSMDSGLRLSPELRSGWRQAKRSFAESRNNAALQWPVTNRAHAVAALRQLLRPS